jgi:XisH protein
MPAKDFFHDCVKLALQKDGWTITDDPFFIRIGGVEMYIDLGAEKMIAAEKAGQKIAVEIKSFSSPSTIYDFHLAIGQFMNYRLALTEKWPGRLLYLAVPVDTYDTFFMLPFVQTAIQHYQLNLIIYDTDQQVILKWLP